MPYVFALAPTLGDPDNPITPLVTVATRWTVALAILTLLTIGLLIRVIVRRRLRTGTGRLTLLASGFSLVACVVVGALTFRLAALASQVVPSGLHINAQIVAANRSAISQANAIGVVLSPLALGALITGVVLLLASLLLDDALRAPRRRQVLQRHADAHGVSGGV